jgi:hypothetical protein
MKGKQMTDDGRRAPSDGKSSHCLWQGELTTVIVFQPITTELGQKTTRCESLRALLPYVEWDRFVTLAGSKSGLFI